MNTKFIVCSILAASSGLLQAQTSPASSSLEFNASVVSDYRYRGISQSASKPALQAGVDFLTESGVYVGAWASSINWIKDTAPSAAYNVKGPVEVDLYGGFKKTLPNGITLDVGVLQYWYPSNNLTNVPLNQNPNTTEVYVAASSGPFSVKLSDSVTTLFGQMNSKGSRYLDLNYALELGNDLTLTPHLGNQYVANNPFSYSDYAITLSKNLGAKLTISGALISTNYKTLHQPYTLPGSGSKDLANSSVVLGLKTLF